jgi:hypothetical protein
MLLFDMMYYRYASGESLGGQRDVLQQLVTGCASWRSLQRLWEIEVRTYGYHWHYTIYNTVMLYSARARRRRLQLHNSTILS